MTSRLTRALGKLVTLREGEAATALLMFAYSFLAMTAYNIVSPITKSKFISDLGADNLPYVQLGAGVLIGVLMQLYSAGFGRLPRRWVIPATQAGAESDCWCCSGSCSGPAPSGCRWRSTSSG